ncbi:hypothetical protein DL764_001717 [Monosporascus ibericus]|uniref:RNase P subunit p30 n=1 Tax=Monosporascus ibericus TaxID=155417 RepID=A0A4Q4TRP1_9PEZI|nr:hypothetical protein DL764_001717 [Monosporascus ibericus]
MLYDLNIAWSPSTSAADLDRTLRFSAALGYNVVALNHTVAPPVPPQIANPLPKFPPSSAGPASSSSSTAPDQTSNKQPKLPTVLHRATLVLNDPSAYHRLPQLVSAYDMVAVRPTTEREFQGACLNLNLTDASLISLDLAQRFPFHFRPKPCMAAVNRGLRFEVCYAQGLSSGSGDAVNDARARAAFIGNVVELVRATRGRGIVISSGARGVLGLRAPADVVNLLALWGLGSEKGMEGLGVLPRGVVVNEGIKRSGFRGVVNIVGTAGRERGEREDEAVGKGKAAAGEAAKERQKKGVKSNNKNENGDNKRKIGEEEDGGGGGPEGDGNKPMSKRQAKKMKAAIRKAQNTEAKTT